MEKSSINLITILGPTASGKTTLAAHLARRIGGEIVSADSRQVYRGMDIGTGKDYDDYLVDGEAVPSHLIDIMDAGYEYNVFLYKQDFLNAFADITGRNRIPVLCGGTGLYIESILRDYKLLQVPVNLSLRADLEQKTYEELEGMLKLYGPLHNRTDTVNRKRLIRAIEIAIHKVTRSDAEDEEPEVELNPVVIGIRLERMVRRRRITERLKKRLDEGLVAEVEGLLANGVTPEKMFYYGLEYRYVTQYIMNELAYEEMVDKLNSAIHQFAKRQMTYFRGMERRGIMIHWINGMLPLEERVEVAMNVI